MEHQFNLGSAVQPQPFIPRNDPDAPMFASIDGVASALSDEEIVFQVRGSNQTQVMTHQVLQCMAACREFRPMDEHIARILRQVPGLTDASRVRQGLEALARSGLLRSDAQFMDEVRTSADPQPPGASTPPTLCIRACDRPATLERLLDSLATNAQRFPAKRPLLLLDDSRDDDNARANRDLLRRHAQASGVDTHYVGAGARRKLLKAVTKALPDAAAAATDLLGARDAKTASGGSVWNLALALTAGRRLALLDEDFVLPLRRPDGWQPGLDVRPGDHRHTRFYPSLDAALAAGSEASDDPLAFHFDCVGQPLATLIDRPGLKLTREDLRGQELVRLKHLLGGTRVHSTMNGTRGAAGSSGGQWLYLLDDASHAEFTRDREAYLHNIEGRSLWHGVARAEPAEQSYFTPFALDNRTLLPCTAPTGGNEDALFGTLLRLCHPQAVTLQLPLSIGHVQERARKRSATTLRALRPNFNAFVYETLLNRLDMVQAEDPGRRLARVADLLDDVAAASVSARVSLLREYLNYTRSDLIARLQQQFADHGDAPVYWQTDVREIITANGRALITPGAPALADWPDDADEATCARLLAAQLQTLTRSLRAWPRIWTFAHERGDRLLATL